MKQQFRDTQQIDRGEQNRRALFRGVFRSVVRLFCEQGTPCFHSLWILAITQLPLDMTPRKLWFRDS